MKVAHVKSRVLLWLDDYRNPHEGGEGRLPSHINYTDIVWVKNFEEFINWINNYGLPFAVSFDHDLADEHYTPSEFWDDYEANEKYQLKKYPTYKEPTGFHCAQWLTNYCNTFNKPLPQFAVHSMNPVGANMIRKHLYDNRPDPDNKLIQLKKLILDEENNQKDQG